MSLAKPRSSRGLGLLNCLWWCLVIAVVSVPGGFANNCELKLHDGSDVSVAHWEVYINMETIGWHNLDDNANPGDIYYKFTDARNVINVQLESEYFEAIYDDATKEVIIITNERFPNFKEDSSTNQRNEINLNFECDGGSRNLEISFKVEDSNKYSPKIEQSEYSYELAMPLAKGYILTSIQPIEGLDYDFTTTNIRALIANSNNDLFTVETIPRVSGENQWRSGFEVKITATKEVRLKEKLEIPLTIQDDGTTTDPTKRTTDISVVIIPDLENTVYNPRFKDPLYNANGQEVTVEEISKGLPLVELIDFEEGYSEDLEYSMLDGGSHGGENANNFINLEKVPESNGVRLVWKTDSDPEQLENFLDKAFALLVLTAEVPTSPLTPSARTVIHIALPGSKIDLTPTTTPEPCPTTVTPTECPICSTPEPCPTTEVPTECPINTTPEPCPTTDVTTECPICTTPEPCPTTDVATECPICTTPEPCPTTDVTTECPTYTTPEPCPTTDVATDCPICTTSEPCPTTETPTEGTTNSDCPTCPTECSAVSTTECPITCPSVSEYPSEGTTNSDCPTCPTECPVTPTTECPITCPSVSEYPSEGTTNSDCPTCPVTPTTECPITCPPVSECPSAGTSTSGPDTTTDSGLIDLEFEKEWYSKTISPNEKEGAEIAHVQLKEKNYDRVTYSLEAGSETTTLAALDINGEGLVTLVLPPRSGTHLYHVIAEVPGIGKGKAQLWLYVSNIPDEFHKFSYALQVRKVLEKTKTQVWPGDGSNEDEQCVTITKGGEFFTMEENIIYSTELDREAEEFNGEESPVLALEIRSCPESETVDSNHAYESSHRMTWDEAVGNITYDQYYTTVAVIIEDANDNAPHFDPASVVIGYPDSDLAAALRMSSVLVAKAEDLDLGMNAALRYSLDESGAKHFEVHPHSGAVYPRNDAKAVDDGFQFNVRATDRDGAPGDEGTHTGDLKVTVRLLNADHLLEVRVSGVLLEDMDDLLESVSAGGGSQRQLRALSAVVLPGDGDANDGGGSSDEGSDEDDGKTEEERGGAQKNQAAALRRRRSARSGAEDAQKKKRTSLNVVVYSIAGGKPEIADNFKSDVEKTLSEQGVPTETSRPKLGNEIIWSKSNNSGLLAAVITLGVLLGLMFIAAGVAGYWFAVRPRMQTSSPPHYDHKSDKLSESMVEIEPISDDFLKSRALEEDLRQETTPDLEVIAEMDIPRPMIIFNDELSREKTEKIGIIDDAISEAGTLDTINTYDTIGSGGDQRPLPKKSVVFNEDVDCIEIRL